MTEVLLPINIAALLGLTFMVGRYAQRFIQMEKDVAAIKGQLQRIANHLMMGHTQMQMPQESGD